MKTPEDYAKEYQKLYFVDGCQYKEFNWFEAIRKAMWDAYKNSAKIAKSAKLRCDHCCDSQTVRHVGVQIAYSILKRAEEICGDGK